MLRQRVHRDDDLMCQISEMTNRFNVAFTSIANNYSGPIGQYNLQIRKEKNPANIPIDEMADTLKSTHIGYSKFGDTVTIFQTELHKKIEMCREEQHDHKNRIEESKNFIKDAKKQRHGLKSKISDIREDIDRYEDEASDLEEDARKEKKKGKKLQSYDYRHFEYEGDPNEAYEEGKGHLKKARRLKKKSERNLEKAENLEEQKHDLKKEKSRLKKDIKAHKVEIEELTQAIYRLSRMSDCLHNNTKIAQSVESVIQDVLLAISEAEKTGEGFAIFQKALSRNPGTFEGRSQKMMEALREKWLVLENFIVYGPQIAIQRCNAFGQPLTNLGQSGNLTFQPLRSIGQPGNNSPQPFSRFRQSGNTSPQPYSSFSQPGNTSPQPYSSFSQPGNTSPQPYSSFSQPGNTSPQPYSSFSQPGNTSPQPYSSFSQP